MDIKSYITSGTLEQYCFGNLNPDLQEEVASLAIQYPEINNELTAIENTIEQLAEIHAVTPAHGLRSKILGTLGFSERLDVNNLPATGKYSDHHSWLAALAHLIPAEPFDDFFMQVVREDDRIAQMLVVTKLNVPEETHQTIAESFFILQGQCKCTVGEQVFNLNAGDYLDVPLHLKHDVQLTTPHVIAILQHQLV